MKREKKGVTSESTLDSRKTKTAREDLAPNTIKGTNHWKYRIALCLECWTQFAFSQYLTFI